ncbi:16S rRNA (cytosine(967)-C(5))-methyltransferase [Candidatus Syntrophocurvum alkaliphilum]|uniref:16S rRNA (cytosine(967)-C(5))-methyltransferase n=1 Tax=Candidatus Syntrophocurvum alkaliphilum TaxID=2293317 RepID=A0A6I6DI78_9FIRM|nr:16S rRNA (cytosine(967)-C(5))-methyltransferase RsmB [Candidatus Syntrophocurvum alkaliphilum]QGT99614.1 16S rRNA (cytosine(967)-C(5))-methyltransferase [Candidatus Syntrophocurvum alkaliphilum]
MNKKKQSEFSKSVRNIALEVVYEVLEKDAYTNIYLDKVLKDKNFPQSDKSLVTELVNGTVRMHKHLDWVLNLFLKAKINKQNPWFRNILRISVYQIIFMDKIPDYAVVDNAVKLTKKKTPGLTSVCNAVLRNILRNRGKLTYPLEKDEIKFLSTFYSHPEWIVELFIDEFGFENTIDILKYNNKPGTIVARNNCLKTTREKLVQELNNENFSAQISDVHPSAIKISKLKKPLNQSIIFNKGWFYVQNEASMLAGLILSPKKEDIIYDLCCGVGGKSTHIAELMGNIGLIYAYDIYEHKLKLLRKNCKRLDISIVKEYCQDIFKIDEANKADKILLDAPCSGLGVLNRRADSRWRKSIEEIKELNKLQKNLLNKASKLVKPGGVLVYSTCTINKSENECIVEDLIRNNEYYLEGFEENISFFPLDKTDRKASEKGMLTIIPGKYQTDGMFYARIRRRSV